MTRLLPLLWCDFWMCGYTLGTFSFLVPVHGNIPEWQGFIYHGSCCNDQSLCCRVPAPLFGATDAKVQVPSAENPGVTGSLLSDEVQWSVLFLIPGSQLPRATFLFLSIMLPLSVLSNLLWKPFSFQSQRMFKRALGSITGWAWCEDLTHAYFLTNHAAGQYQEIVQIQENIREKNCV